MKYYVYELVIVPGGTVCYVGKGSGQRMYKHRRYALQPPSKTQLYLYHGLSDLIASGKDFKPRKVFETDDEIEALMEERRRIRFYGVDTLLNWGESHTGPLAGHIKEARREAMRKARKVYCDKLEAETGHRMLPEIAARISTSNKGKVVSPEHVAKVQAARAANPGLQAWLKQHCRSMAKAQLGQKQSLEHVEKCAAAHRGLKRTPEQRDKISRANMGRMTRIVGAKSSYRGVTWFAPGKSWQCRVTIDRKLVCLGYFKLEVDAAWTYDNAFEQHYGNRLNGTPKEHSITRYKRGQHGKLVER